MNEEQNIGTAVLSREFDLRVFSPDTDYPNRLEERVYGGDEPELLLAKIWGIASPTIYNLEFHLTCDTDYDEARYGITKITCDEIPDIDDRFSENDKRFLLFILDEEISELDFNFD